jgi:hypothetical protein
MIVLSGGWDDPGSADDHRERNGVDHREFQHGAQRAETPLASAARGDVDPEGVDDDALGHEE